MSKAGSIAKSTIGKASKATGIGAMDVGFMMFGGVASYKISRGDGHGVLYSLGKVAVDEVFYSTPIGKAAMAVQFAGMGAEYAAEIGRKNAKISQRAYKGNFGGNYTQSQNGYTMRQRGLNAINNAGVNGKQALGSEAKTFHRMHYND